MIDEEKTFAERGYRSTELSKWSHKEVWAVCEGENCQREGGRGRWVKKCNYHILCHLCAVRNKPMQKCETPTEKLPWVDDDITFAEKGYRSTELMHGSNKPVWAICQGENCERKGGRGRWVVYQRCTALCHGCATKKLDIVNECYTAEKLPWVDDEITFAEKGYRSIWLRPKSGREVWCVCANTDCEREGGRGRWVMFKDCRELCISCAHKTDEIRIKHSECKKGEKHPNWKCGITPENRKFYNSREYDIWRRSVFERDEYTCQECGERGVVLNSHHILPIRDWKEPRFSLNIKNGITLCEDCHRETYGKEYEFFNKYFDIANGVGKYKR